MPGTRTAEPGSPLRQERWASSVAHTQGLKANLVARRCRVVADATTRELIWMIQARSNEAGGLPAMAGELATVAPQACGPKGAKSLVDWLTEFCLNPETLSTDSFLGALRAYALERAQCAAATVVTTVGKAINSALDYALEQRCMIVVEGVARLGKTFVVSHWCAARPGRVRYMQCPSTNDDVAFFAAMARALGLIVESTPKTKNLRPRIEDTLQAGDLMLVIDEAHNCWPGHSYRNARPSRICWLMTALVNCNVPVALVVTPQFFRAQKVCEERIGWASEQFVGRIGDYVKLPDELSIGDLRSVARAHLPEGDATSIEALALYAGSSQKYLAAIEHAVKKARYLAGQAGRSGVTQGDIRTAIESGMIPSDSALAAAIRSSGSPRSPVANHLREVREVLAVEPNPPGAIRRLPGEGKFSGNHPTLALPAKN